MSVPTQPNAMRRHVAIVGDTNAGKSTLFNALTGQENAIVSEQRGTTTDPVQKAMELIPFGPIVLIDTAGFADDSVLAGKRLEKTLAACRRADALIYTADVQEFSATDYEAFRAKEIPHLLVVTKSDLVGKPVLQALHEIYSDAVFFGTGGDVSVLHERLSALLATLEPDERPLLGDLVPAGGTVVLVVPIDSEAPKGRIILPQVQAIRDCLDHGLRAVVVRETELADTLQALPCPDLVVTDSQAFALVDEIVPPEIPLTSFSLLLARTRGNFGQLLEGVRAVESLPDGATVLMLEGCTHNSNHDDIGRVRIPALLRKCTGKRLQFDMRSGYDFPADLSGYHMAIQCGCCMLSGAEIRNRLRLLARAGIPVTNYGIMLAWGAGILERAAGVFKGRVNSWAFPR